MYDCTFCTFSVKICNTCTVCHTKPKSSTSVLFVHFRLDMYIMYSICTNMYNMYRCTLAASWRWSGIFIKIGPAAHVNLAQDTAISLYITTVISYHLGSIFFRSTNSNERKSLLPSTKACWDRTLGRT